MKSSSPKLNFLNQGGGELDESDLADNLIHVDRTAYNPGKIAQRFHGSLARTKLARGGLGGGKTRTATEHANALCLEYPGIMGVIARKDMTVLKDTTQKEFLEKVVAPETIAQFNVNDNRLYYKNGSVVIFRDAKDPDSFKSLELGWYLIDEADENPDEQLWFKLDQRLRQKVRIGGELVEPPYCGMLVFNPTDEEHWLYRLAQRTDVDVEDFQFSTFDNAHNLPDAYIPNLIRSLPPWEVQRLVYGNWGRQVKGKPVIHGFTYEEHVRTLKMRSDLPLLRGWDFGFNHPAVVFCQLDPITGHFYIIREFLGSKLYLHEVVPEVKKITRELVGEGYPIFDYGDPHGNDKSAAAEPAIKQLKDQFGIHVISRRERVKTGLETLQMKVITTARAKKPDFWALPDNEKFTEKEQPLLQVDHTCRIVAAAISGGYHRDDEGNPVKDGYYDHLIDCVRYILINNQHASAMLRSRTARRHSPSNRYTGY